MLRTGRFLRAAAVPGRFYALDLRRGKGVSLTALYSHRRGWRFVGYIHVGGACVQLSSLAVSRERVRELLDGARREQAAQRTKGEINVDMQSE